MNKKTAMSASVFKPLLIAVASLALMTAGSAFATTAGEVSNLSGTLSVKRADGSTKLLAVKSEVQPGDTLATEAGTYARVKFIDGGEVVLRPGTQMKVDNFSYDAAKPKDDSQLISLLKGGMRFLTGALGHRSKDRVSYVTPTATIGIRGTEGGIQLNDDNSLNVDVGSGAVVVKNTGGELEVSVGQFAFVKSGEAPPTLIVNGKKVVIPENIGAGVGAEKNASCSIH